MTTGSAMRKPGTALTFTRARLAVRDRVRRRPRLRVLLWWWASFITLVIYALLRDRMDDLGFPVHGSAIERGLFGSLPTLWLQGHVYPLSPHLLEWATVAVHMSWLVVPGLAAVLVSFKRPDRIGSFFRWWIALQALALIIWAIFPLEPPWMASHDVVRIIAIYRDGTIPDGNPLAAMPSLHVAFPVLIAFWFYRERWKPPALAMLGYSSLVALEVVFSGEHYVVDVIGAVAAAGVIYLAAQVDYAAVLQALSRTRLMVGFASRRPALALRAIRKARRQEVGQVLIEFAFVMPIFLVLLLVLVDFGIALDHRLVLQHAVSEGVREAMVTDQTSQVIDTTVDQSQGLLTSSDVSVSYEGCNPGDKVRVAVSYTYEFSAGGGELLSYFGVPVPSIEMNPSAVAALQLEVDPCPP
jgi:hypothetical protein